jgi:uncharacterized RDD family membrane protein YckC
MSQQAPVQTVLACSQCGRTFAHSDLVQIAGNWVCAGCKPGYLSRVMASGGAASAVGWHYGGFWIRFGARMIDGFVLGVPLLILAALLIPNLMKVQGTAPNPAALPGIAAFGVTLFLIYFVVLICYEVLFLKYRGATPGKMACGLKVVRSDGSSLEWGVTIGRFVMWNFVTSGIPYINFILMLISGIMAGTDGEKRALHDRVCDTRVVYKQSLA